MVRNGSKLLRLLSEIEIMKTPFTFQKSLLSMYLNSWGVDKYISEKGQIKLVVTHATEGDTDISMTFDKQEAYEIWMDSVVDDNDYHYNEARALACVLSGLSDKFDFDL